MVHKRIGSFFRRRRLSQPTRARAARRRVSSIVSRTRARVRKVSAERRARGEPSTGAILGAVTPVGKAVTVGKSVVTGIKTFTSRVLGNPLAGSATVGAGLKAFGKRAGGRALGLGIGIETFQFGRAKATGKPFDPIPDLGLVASAALNPFATIGGLLFGGGERAVQVGTETIKEIIKRDPVRDFQPFDFGGFEQGDVTINFPSGTSQDFAPSSPQPPVGAFFPSVDLQVGAQVGGGQNELLRLLILLLGAGGLGAVLGRKSKKKKKKKSKKDDDDEEED